LQKIDQKFVMRSGNRFAPSAFMSVAQAFTSHSRRSFQASGLRRVVATDSIGNATLA
jgi:hypothetical protein